MNRHERRKNKGKGLENREFFAELSSAIEIHKLRNFIDAENIYKKLLVTHPTSYELNRHMGILYQDTGRVEDSFSYFVECIKKNPNGYEAYNNMGTSYVLVKDYNLAVKCFNKSLSLSDKYPPAISNLANLYNRRGDGENSLKYAQTLLEIEPDNSKAKSTYAKALILNHEIDKAIELMAELVNKYPEDEEFQINLATAYREIGEFDKSKKIVNTGFKKLFGRRLNNEPVKNLIQFFAQYASDKSNKLTNEELEFFLDRLATGNLNIDQKITLSKGMFEYFRNHHEFEKSYKYLQMMNEFCFEIQDYDLERDKSLFEKIAEEKEYPSFTFTKNSIVPVFICGMPRSGTTLCEQILSAHSNVYGAGELRYLLQLTNLQELMNQPENYDVNEYFENLTKKQTLANLRKQYLEMISNINKEGVKFICDKMPHNFLLIDLIRAILPEAKIIYCKRNPIDNCFSLFTQRFVEGRHQYCYNQKTLSNYYKFHQKLMNGWLKRFKEDIFVLDNEELVADQKNVTTNLLNFCNLEWQDTCLEFYKNKRQVRTASLEQVREPINKRSIGAWEKYKPYLSEMIEALG